MENTVLIVDDNVVNTKVLSLILKDEGYLIRCLNDPTKVMDALEEQIPDIILLDVDMPDITGFELCAQLKSSELYKDISIIFISAMTNTEDIVQGFQLGAVDYIAKPFRAKEVQVRLSTHMKICNFHNNLQKNNEALKAKIRSQFKEITDAQMHTIFALAKLSQSRDDDTGGHLERVRLFCRTLAKDLSINSPYGEFEEIDDEFVKDIANASPLHDIGKVGIPDAILLKPGRLTHEEFEVMKTHTTIGAETLASTHYQYQGNKFIETGISIAKYHHEKWDGSGYPEGLKGSDIPLAARIMAVADVYDALRAKRSYKDSFSHEKSIAIIKEGKGAHFDPLVVEALERIEKDFDAIWTEINSEEMAKEQQREITKAAYEAT